MLGQWDDLASTKSYLTGGVGSRHVDESIGDPYELPPDRAYCETCAAIASIMWSWRLLLVTGESRFADLLERTLYNGFLSGVSLDGRTFFYSNPLHSRGGHERHTWNPVACCPPNIMRFLASVEQHLATTSPDGVQLHQYAPARLAAGSAVLRIDTAYPWKGTVEIEIVGSGEEPWTLSLRIPGWARVATVDGAPATAGGYADVTRRWRAGDRVVLELDVSPRLTAANPRIDAVRGCLAVERGPLVYCFEETDLPQGVDLADVRLDASVPLRDAGPVETLAGIQGVAAAGIVPSLDGWQRAEYRDTRELSSPQDPRQASLLAVPYFAWANRGAGAMRVWIPHTG
jgi:DUF1680 family protein